MREREGQGATYGAAWEGASLQPRAASPSRRAGSPTHCGTSAWRSAGVSACRRRRRRRRDQRRRARRPRGRRGSRRPRCCRGGGRPGRGGRWGAGGPLLPTPVWAARRWTRTGGAAASARAQRDCRGASGAVCRSRYPCCRGVGGTAWLDVVAIVIIHGGAEKTGGTLSGWAFFFFSFSRLELGGRGQGTRKAESAALSIGATPAGNPCAVAMLAEKMRELASHESRSAVGRGERRDGSRRGGGGGGGKREREGVVFVRADGILPDDGIDEEGQGWGRSSSSSSSSTRPGSR